MAKGFEIVTVSGGKYIKPKTLRQVRFGITYGRCLFRLCESCCRSGGSEISRVQCRYGRGGDIPRGCPLRQKPVVIKVK